MYDNADESMKNDLSQKLLRVDIDSNKQDGDTVCCACFRFYREGKLVLPDGNYMEDSSITVNVKLANAGGAEF